jgi:hypothetical protein
MTIDDYEDLVGGLEEGIVPGWFAAETAGHLRPMLSPSQLVRLAADFAYDQLDSCPWHPENSGAVKRLLARFDQVGESRG